MKNIDLDWNKNNKNCIDICHNEITCKLNKGYVKWVFSEKIRRY